MEQMGVISRGAAGERWRRRREDIG